MNTILILSVLLIIASTSAWSSSVYSRRGFVQQIASSTTAALLAVPSVANADITNKIASSSALRTVKSAEKKLVALQDTVELGEYLSFKDALRLAPLSDLRKSCSTLVKGGEDGPKAQELSDRYKAFITSLEKADSIASLGMRGKKLADGELKGAYEASVKALRDFLAVAEAASEIPVQYKDESSVSLL